MALILHLIPDLQLTVAIFLTSKQEQISLVQLSFQLTVSFNSDKNVIIKW